MNSSPEPGAGVVGVGTDLVNIPRFDRAVARWGKRFLLRIFTSAEMDYAHRRRRTSHHLSARFAGKEAVIKALGTGFSEGRKMREVEILPDGLGRPCVRLHGTTLKLAADRGVRKVFLSLSHSEELATAQAVAVGRTGYEEEGHELSRDQDS